MSNLLINQRILKMEKTKKRIAAPSVTKNATEKLLRKMYISNVAKRLRELNAPTDIDRKRWVWELIQNAKDTIASDHNRNDINVKIEIEGDVVKFRHDGNPFTADARFGLLFKYSEDKENQESTGRFGTGFLTTHCLSKVVSIESNMYTNEEQTKVCGFCVTMYRDGAIEQELLEGLDKMEKSEDWLEEPFEWTTFTYHVSTESGRKAIQLGVENFHENIAQTMLFCKELASVELINNGIVTKIIRKPEINLSTDVKSAEFEIWNDSEITAIRRFVFTSYENYNEELSNRYKANRKIRINAAIEVDSENKIISQKGKTSHYCVLPLVGVENQLNEPLILNSPDFEPDSERQSLVLVGQDWNEEGNTITETGINQLIYKEVFPLYEKLVEYLTVNKFGNLYYLANGLKSVKKHDKLDDRWYTENVINNYRKVLLKYAVVEPANGADYMRLSDCIFAKEGKKEHEEVVYDFLKMICASKLSKDNNAWSTILWKEDLNLWNLEELCVYIENKENWENIGISEDLLEEWYNKFLDFVNEYDERLLNEHALLPNMNGDLLKKNEPEFKQGEHVTPFVVNLLNDLGKDVKPMLLHMGIHSIGLAAKYNSQSYSADINKLIKDLLGGNCNLNQLMPLISVVPNDESRFDNKFINKRKDLFEIITALFDLEDCHIVCDNSLLESAWNELDKWIVDFIPYQISKLDNLSNLPNGLDCTWLNKALLVLGLNTNKYNEYCVLPNQNGDFCEYKDLYYDDDIPECLKTEIFDSIGLSYKDILLHKDIDADAFSISKSKSISDFAKELNNELKTTNQATSAVARYMVGILPANKEGKVYEYQLSLYNIAKELQIVSQEIDYIEYEKEDLWQECSTNILQQICDKIEEFNTLEELCDFLEVGEKDAVEIINSYCAYHNYANINYSTDKVMPNQNGVLCRKDDLYKEDGSINETLKDIISKLVSSGEEYRNVLMDKRINAQPERSINEGNAYKLVDDKIDAFYQNPSRWDDEDFIEATQLLIEGWGDKHDGLFKEYFPRTYPNKEKILMNVVWKKEKRELMLKVSSKLTEEQLLVIVENHARFDELATKVSALEIENEKLKNELARLMKDEAQELSINEDREETVIKTVPKVHEITVANFEGKNQSIRIDQQQYAGLSVEEVVKYVHEAKKAVVKRFKELNERENLGLTFDNERIDMDSFSQLYGIYDKNGNELPLVVHSYKGPQYRYFDLNWYDWQLLSRPGSMLWVMTITGLQCIPLFALPVRNFNFAVDSCESNNKRAALLTLAAVGKQYSRISFDFGNNMPQGFIAPRAFDFVPEELSTCVAEIKQACDNYLPQIAPMYNHGECIPLVSGDVNYYSQALKEFEETGTMRDQFEAPCNEVMMPSIGTGYFD